MNPMKQEDTTATKKRAPLPVQGRRSRPDESGDPDLVRFYLDEIGMTPLLTAEEEVELSKRIEAGLYAERLLVEASQKGGRRIGPKRRLELERLAADGVAAKDHMVRANLRLVVSVAKKFAGRDAAFLDVVQEGNLGLIRAVEKFDYSKGYKFSTYATWWIRQAIQRGLGELGRTVRLPVHVVEELSRLNRLERTLSASLGRDPSVEELAEAFEAPVERVIELKHIGRVPVSLDQNVGDDGDTRIADLICDDDAVAAAEIAEHNAMLDTLRSMVRSLPERQATVLTMRYGLRDGKPRTLAEIAAPLGLTRERVRQLEKEALAALRAPDSELVGWS
ncbi:sigma-70 family RNA polymerase sigma factor [Sporichthya polymorpha]|uniref:sigma-70 family RNA polymerase sigma factor n=1 Tax=Sporichthya polymorpha TaxID=35751 RepID=UPI00036C3572|nr:sigma-70 family RNA polymerase sigma factor [Sporichthya polymorpha]